MTIIEKVIHSKITEEVCSWLFIGIVVSGIVWIMCEIF